MKTTLILSYLFICTASVMGQAILIGVQTEITVAGYQYGGSMLHETARKWGYGVFYQTSLSKSYEEANKKLLYGIQLQAPLAKSERIKFFATLKGGLANKQFVVVIPGLETHISIRNRLGFAFGMSMRMSYPAISSKVIIKLF